MARTWDTPSSYNTTTAFTTARSYSHTVGAGSNRMIFHAETNEDFSTGGGAQTPSSVVYGGNALTLCSIATVSSVQTAALYHGQDSVCGSAGAHNMVVTYAGQVDATCMRAFSCDNMVQAIKEATGSLVQSTSVSGGTTTVTTVSAEALIVAVAGNDEGTAGSGGTVTNSWNVGTSIGDINNAGVGGSFVYYEKATAGSQGMTVTLGESVGRLCMVSAAFATINYAGPVNTIPGTQTCSIRNQKSITGISVAEGLYALASIQVSVETPATVTISDLAGCTVSDGTLGTQMFKLSGSTANLNAAIATLKSDYPGWTDAEAALGIWPIFDDTVIVTILSTDSNALTDSDTITCNWSLVAGNGTTRLTLSHATLAGINAEVDDAYYIPVHDSITNRYMYAQVGDGNGGYDTGIIEIIMGPYHLPTLNDSNSSPVGIWIDEEMMITQVIDALMQSIGAWWSFTRLGVMTGGVLISPIPSSVKIVVSDIILIERLAGSGTGQAIPNSSVELTYQKNYTVQTGDALAGLASSVPARVAFAGQEFRKITKVDATTQSTFPLSQPLQQETLLASDLDADEEAIRLLAMMKEQRDFLRVGLSADHPAASMNLGQTVNLTIPRFGYDTGRDFVIIGFEEWQPNAGQVIVQLWG